MKINNNTGSEQRILGDFVNREIVACHTSLIEKLLAENIVEFEDIENNFDEDEDGDTTHKEAFEWWQVTTWFYDKLKAHDEMVINTDYGYFWGRTCTGQSISLDNIILEIYNSIQ